MNHTDELTDEKYQKLTNYINAGAYSFRSRNGFRIPALVVEQWSHKGYAVLYTNTLAKHYGVSRKTMWRTITSCIRAEFIKEVGRTGDGRAMYVPCFERGDEWRIENDRRMATHEAA